MITDMVAVMSKGRSLRTAGHPMSPSTGWVGEIVLHVVELPDPVELRRREERALRWWGWRFFVERRRMPFSSRFPQLPYRPPCFGTGIRRRSPTALSSLDQGVHDGRAERTENNFPYIDDTQSPTLS